MTQRPKRDKKASSSRKRKKQTNSSSLPQALSEMMIHLQLATKSASFVGGELINNRIQHQLDFVDLSIPVNKQCGSQIRFIIKRRLENLFLSFNSEFFLVGRNIPFVSDLVFFSRTLRCLLMVEIQIMKLQQNDFERVNERLFFAREELTKVGENPPIALLVCVSQEERKAEYVTKCLPTKMFEKEYLSLLPPIDYIEEELENWIDNIQKPVWERWNKDNPRRIVDLDYEILMEGIRRVFTNYPSTGKKAVYL